MHLRQIDADAASGPRRRFDRRAGKPGGAQILDRQHRAGVHRLQASLDQRLFQKGIAHLNRGPPFRFLLERARGQPRCAVNAVAPGIRPGQQQYAAGNPRRRRCQPVLFDHPGAHRVDQRIVGIGGVKVDFAPHIGHPDAVAVPRNAAHHAAQ